MTNEKRCLLAGKCKLAGSAECTNTCQHFVSMHGMSGTGGRTGAANVPKDYALTTVANSPARASQQAIYKAVDAYIRTFERQFDESGERIKSLYLFSESPGTGKTTTAASIMNAYITAHYLGSLKRGRQALQQPAYFLDCNAFQTDYNLATMINDEDGIATIKATIKRAQVAPFAVLDDIGVRSASEAFRAYVHAIINYRTTNGLPTVFTSNLPIEEMAVVFDARLYDRMRDMCAVLSFVGESKRGRR
ncbi:MAG: DNA replication protein [Bacillota bacterium]